MKYWNGERIKSAIADLARPFVLYANGGATAAAITKLAWTDKADLSAAAVFITAAGGVVVGLYWGKSWENTRTEQAKQASTSSTPAPGTAVVKAAADVDVSIRSAEGADDELPPEKRIRVP